MLELVFGICLADIKGSDGLELVNLNPTIIIKIKRLMKVPVSII